MAFPIELIVDATVNVIGSTPERFSFGTYLGAFEHNLTANRVDGPYASVAEGEAAGFTVGAVPEVYYWLNSVFGQENGVDAAVVGRKIPSTGGLLEQVWQVDATGPTFVDETTDANDAGTADWTIFPATEAVGDYVAIGQPVPWDSVTLNNASGTAGVDGGSLAVAYEYWNGAAWTALSGVTDGTTMFTAAASDGQVLSFTQPVDWAPVILDVEALPLYYIRVRITAGTYSTNPVYDSGYITGDASWPVALSAIEAANGADSFYGLTIESRVQADVEAVAAWNESRFHLFMPQSQDATYLAGTAGNVGLVLEAAGYKRTVGPLYHAASSGAANGYADGSWMSRGLGFDLDAPNGRKLWAFKALPGITPDAITTAQFNNILDANGNVYASVKSQSITWPGLVAFGKPWYADVRTTVDWIDVRIQETVVAAFAGIDIVPYTNAGIQYLAAAVQEQLDKGVTYGHFSGDPGLEPQVVTPDVSEISDEDKQNRVLTLTASATFAGGIQTLNITINVDFS